MKDPTRRRDEVEGVQALKAVMVEKRTTSIHVDAAPGLFSIVVASPFFLLPCAHGIQRHTFFIIIIADQNRQVKKRTGSNETLNRKREKKVKRRTESVFYFPFPVYLFHLGVVLRRHYTYA